MCTYTYVFQPDRTPSLVRGREKVIAFITELLKFHNTELEAAAVEWEREQKPIDRWERITYVLLLAGWLLHICNGSRYRYSAFMPSERALLFVAPVYILSSRVMG